MIRDFSADAARPASLQPWCEWGDCKPCSSFNIYRNAELALNHVQVHFYSRYRLLTTDLIARWLRDDQQYCMDQRLELYLSCLDISISYLCVIKSKAQSLRAGVASSDGEHPSRRFKLPSSLLKAFENVTMLLVYTALSFELADKFCKRLGEHTESKEKETYHRLVLSDVRDNLDTSGSAAVLLMEKAEGDMMLMAHTGIDTGIISYDAVGPEYVLATIMANLYDHPLHKTDSIEKVYTSYYEKLVSVRDCITIFVLAPTFQILADISLQYAEVLKHPRARIIREIFLMSEEVSQIVLRRRNQRILMRDFTRNLEPCSYKVTTKLRCARYGAEWSFLKGRSTEAHNLEEGWNRLDARLNNLHKNVFQMLKVSDENSANAIMVFTIVATIFLPLSWATSYLGMNTADVRNLEQGQWLFWTIAGPLAALVIGIALVAALRGEAIREYMIERRQRGMEYAAKRPDTGIGRSSTMMSGILNARTRTATEGNSWLRVRRNKARPKSNGDV